MTRAISNPARHGAATARRRFPFAAALLVLTAAFGGVAAPLARADAAAAAKLVEEANRKVRQRDLQAALKLLETAIQSDPSSVDANVRYQDLARDVYGVQQVQAKYDEIAKSRPDDVVAQFLSARLLAPAAAAAAFEKLAAKFAESPWPCAGRARALEDLGRFKDAVEAHAQALIRAGDNPVRFLAYRAYSYERSGQWSLAAESWQAVIGKSPADVSARLGLAEALRKAQRPDEALQALDDAAKSGVADAELAYRRGLVHMDAQRWDKALEAFDGAITADKSMFEALCAACDAATRQAKAVAEAAGKEPTDKDFDRAVSYGDRAVLANADSAYAHFVLGAAHEAAGWFNADRLDDAQREYDLALERLPIPGPDKVHALTAKSYVLLLKAEWAAALDVAQKAIDIDKNCIVAYGHCAYALVVQEKQQDAINRYYNPALKIAPNNARLLHDKGIALWQLKKPNEAKKPLEDARNAEPRNGDYRLSLGELYYEMKRHKEAMNELLEAVTLIPKRAAAWRSYARACYAAKSFEECARGYTKYVELDDKAVNEWLYLAVVCAEELKDKERARKAILKFKEKGGADDNLEDWMNQILNDGGAPGK